MWTHFLFIYEIIFRFTLNFEAYNFLLRSLTKFIKHVYAFPDTSHTIFEDYKATYHDNFDLSVLHFPQTA